MGSATSSRTSWIPMSLDQESYWPGAHCLVCIRLPLLHPHPPNPLLIPDSKSSLPWFPSLSISVYLYGGDGPKLFWYVNYILFCCSISFYCHLNWIPAPLLKMMWRLRHLGCVHTVPLKHNQSTYFTSKHSGSCSLLRVAGHCYSGRGKLQCP